MIWLGLCCAALLLLVCLWLLRVFYAANATPLARSALEQAEHQRQMEAIDQEEATGRLNPEEAQALRLEAQRRLLRNQRTLPTHKNMSPAPPPDLASSRPAWYSAAALILLATSTGLLGYALLGSPGMPAKPAPARLVTPQDQTALAQAQQALIANPDDTRAWLELTTTLSSMGRTRQAADTLSFALQRLSALTYGSHSASRCLSMALAR
jgi:cytochrome c-type biogenesis protein CcmH